MKYINVNIPPNKIIGRLMNIEPNPKTNSFGILRFQGSRFASDLLTEKYPKLKKKRPVIKEIDAALSLFDFVFLLIELELGA